MSEEWEHTYCNALVEPDNDAGTFARIWSFGVAVYMLLIFSIAILAYPESQATQFAFVLSAALLLLIFHTAAWTVACLSREEQQ